MEFKLNEYCLNHIFSYLKPHDLIHVSEVCRFWKQVALRLWKNITSIECFFDYYKGYDEVVVISSQDAKKIVAHAAQFIRVLNAINNNEENNYFKFGNYNYEVKEHFDPDTILEVLIRNRATKVIEAGFRSPPKTDLMRSFLQTNKVKKLRYEDFAGYHQHIPTDGIEDLTLHFQSINENLHSFAGHFPDLKKLNLILETDDYTFLSQMLLKILPHVKRITSFRLTDDPMYYDMDWDKNLSGAEQILRRKLRHAKRANLKISKLSELLQHEIDFNNANKYKIGTALNLIRWAYCPKIRVLDLDMIAGFDNRHLQSLMSLPYLKVLNITLPCRSFHLMTFSEMKNLTSLKLHFSLKSNTTRFFSAVQMMPKLQKIDFCSLYYISKERQLQLICDVVRAATLLGKDILISKLDSDDDDKILKVEKKTRRQNTDLVEKSQTLHIRLSYSLEISATENFFLLEELLQDLRKFVQSELDGYHVDILESNCKK